jgi:hypothetical protein
MSGVVARTLRPASRHQPPPGPLPITPVRLGYSTLVLFQGPLDQATAGDDDPLIVGTGGTNHETGAHAGRRSR